MTFLLALAVAAVTGVTPPAFAGPERRGVTFERQPGRVRIHLGGELLATYVYVDPTIKRPFLANVKVPGGEQVTRSHPPVEGKDATDHSTMHPGIWLAFGDISGADFWRNRARVEHERFVTEPTGGLNEGSFAVLNRYVAGDKVICRQTCRYVVRRHAAGSLLIVDSEFRGDGADFYFGDQEEMGLGIRVATPLAVRRGGRMIDSEGRVDEKEIWGKQANWCDYSGKSGGERIGILLMPDPKNPHRSWFHARDYGALVANPFGRRSGAGQRTVVRSGDSLTLRFGVLLHASPEDRPLALDEAYREFLRLLPARRGD